MFIDDYIEKIALQEELKNVKEQLKAVQEENTELKTALEWHRKDNEGKRSILLEKNERIAKLMGDIHKLKGELKILKYNDSVLRKNAAECKLMLNKVNEEKQQEGDNLRNRIKDLESEIDELKKNPSAAVNAEMIAIHTADVETIKTLLDRLSKSTDENQELKKKVQELKDIIKDLGAKLYK